MKRLPDFLKEYFLDVDIEKINLEKASFFVTERLLEYGDSREIRWVFKVYGKKIIKKVIMISINISPKTGNFWADMLNVPKSKVPSLKNGLPNWSDSTWSYQINN